MRLSKTALGGVFLAGIALASCTAPGQLSRSEENKRMIESEYGAVGKDSNPEVFRMNAQDGDGFAMFRLYSEKPVPNSFSTTVPERFENTLVVDFGVEMEIEDQFPIYRIGMDPVKISQRRIDLWPSHVLMEAPSEGGKTLKLAARLPEERIPGPDGMIWSDWTYCADCFDLDDIRDAGVENEREAFAALVQAYKVSTTKNGTESPYVGRAKFTSVPGVGILVGDSARERAHKASDLVMASRARIAEMRPARDAYEALRKDFSESRSPTAEVERLCGIYEPNRDMIDLETEKSRIDAYLDCGVATLDGFSVGQRQDELAGLKAYEREVAAKARLKSSERIVFPSIDEEFAAAEDVLEQARGRFIEFAKAVSAPAKAPEADPIAKPDPEVKNDVIIQEAREAIDQAAIQAKPVAQVVTPVPVVSEEVPEVQKSPEPPVKDTYFVARLLPDGANMSIGQQKIGCIGDMSCETGSIVALITATGYCHVEGGITKTSPNWGMLVQRYMPDTREQEEMILAGDGKSKVHVVADKDEDAMMEGLAAVRALKMNGDPLFFTTYQSFYEVNTEEKGCKDIWRDSAKNRVIQNPEAAIDH